MVTYSMGLTTERKVFFGLVGIAGLALIIDQGFLGPKEAGAEPLPIAAGSTLPVETTSTPQSKPAKPAAMILIDRLESISTSDQSESFGSSFLLTKLIEPSLALPISDEPNEVIQIDTPSGSFPLVAATASDLPVLSSVMPTANGGGGAVLGGKLLRVGQVGPNGYRLVLVHARAVLVERDGVQFAIEIPTIYGQD